MHKIVFVVAVFAFALQGALGRYAVDSDKVSSDLKVAADIPVAAPVYKPLPSAEKSASAVENKPEETPGTTATTPAVSTSTESVNTTPKNGGASSSEICVLLVQVSSLALVVKHALL